MSAEGLPLFHWLNERAAGVLLHPISFPGSTGIGTFGASARQFIDFLAEAGMKYWQVFPLGPTGYGDSPYQCFSAFAGNPYFIDLETLIEDGFLEEADMIDLRTLPSDRVDYGAQWMLRWPVLKKAFRSFAERASAAEEKDFRRFRRQHKEWLTPYTQFIALKAHFGGVSWQEWPDDFRYYSKARKHIKALPLGEEIDAHAWFQFQFFQQWSALKQYANERGISVFGDIPIFVSMDSADVWTHPSLFQMNRNLRPTGVAGVPPDYFAADGQLWGNPLYDWRRHQASQFAWWLDRLRASFELYDVVRIDHFRGFDEYCRIPPNAENARVYEWLPGPGLALFEAMKERFPEAKLVAEDLGVITETVRELVEKCGFPGMKILQFAFEGATEYLPHNTVPNSVLYPGTHDNDTAWGWYQKASESVKDCFREYLKVAGTEVAWDMIRAGYASQSRLFIFPLQDLLDLGTEARMNIPGQPAGNWQWRYSFAQLENLRTNKASYLKELAEKTGR